MDKSKKTLIFAIIALAVAGALIYWGRNSSEKTGNVSLFGASLVSFGEQVPEFDFGTVSMARGKVAHDFELSNSSGADVAISKAETSCMCTEVLLILPNGQEAGPFGMAGMGVNAPAAEIIVKPGEKLTARAIFDPAAHGPAGIGKVERQIALSGGNGRYLLSFRAEVTP